MSIIIEGSESAGTWQGGWYFAKDKGSEPRRDFSYKKIGNSIPKEMLDYVSFVNPNAGDNIRALANRFRGSVSGSGKKRGRPPNKDRRFRATSVPTLSPSSGKG